MTLPAVEEFRSGVWSVPLPMAGSPLAYVCTYAAEVDGGFVLVDAGWNTPDTFEALEDAMAQVGAGVGDIRGVLVTHIHPDHYGLAGRIREVSGGWIAMHPDDARLIGPRYEDVDDLLEETAGWLATTGAPSAEIEELRDASLGMRDLVVTTRPDVLLEDGDRVDVAGRDIAALHTPGHTPGHLCFHDRDADVLFTGDHVLPRITPHVGYNPQSGPNPLDDYLEALEHVRGVGAVVAAPGHEYRFAQLEERLDELHEHHEERLKDVARIVADGADTVWDVARAYPWSRGWDRLHGFMLRAALAEVHAHLVTLERRGRLKALDGVPVRWRATET